MLSEGEIVVKRKRGRPPKNKGLPHMNLKVTNGFAAPIPVSTDHGTPVLGSSEMSKADDKTDIKL